MKNPISSLLEFIKSIFGKKKQPVLRCQFCGEKGHEENDCPNAAKYKLFNVDRE
jgi:hypothetical protein